MKPFEAKRFFLITITWIIWFSFNKHEAFSFPLTGQYLGTKSSGNEHVLLFKLPRSITNQMQEQLQMKNSDFNMDQILRQANEEPQVEQQPSLNNQPLSLTIPLSAVTATNQTEYVYMVPRPFENLQQPSRSAHYEAPLVDYLSAESIGHEVIEQKQQEPYLPSLSITTQIANAQNEQNQQHQTTNLTSVEQQMRQYLQRQADNFTTTSLSIIDSTTDQPAFNQEQQSNLWLGSQKGSLQVPMRMNNQSEHNHQLSTNLLAKLAASSPDLLLRLKSLLNRSGTRSQQSENSDHLADYTKGGLIGANLKSQALDTVGKNATSDRTLLDTFLSTQNLSSHEEIEIPLIVIAMPRIVSLKRNHLRSNYPISTSSNNGQVSSKLALFENTLGSLNDRNSNSNAPLNFPVLDNSLNNSNNANSSFQTPFLYLAKRTSPHSLKSEMYPTNLQQDTVTEPQHTMAPYARQFSFLSSSGKPYLQQQPTYQPTVTTIDTAGQLQNPYETKDDYQKPFSKTSEIADQAFHIFYPSRQSAESSQVAAAARQNITSFIQLAQANPAFQNIGLQQQQTKENQLANLLSNNNRVRQIPQFQIQSQEVDPALTANRVRPSLASYNRLATELSYPQLGELSQTRFDSQDRHSSLVEQSPRETGENVWISKQPHQTVRPARSLALSDLTSTQNRIAMLEQRLARLRPLFRADNNQLGGLGDIRDQLRIPRNKLTREQLLSLVSPHEHLDFATAASRRQDQLTPKEITHNSANLSKDNAKKAPKMVLMIVR